MAARSCDVILSDTHKVHIAIIPKLSLIIVNELEDFAESWFEIKVVQNSICRSFYDIKTLAGDIKQQTSCRYLIESVHKELQNIGGCLPDQISSVFKFLINISLSHEIFSSRPHMNSLRMVLRDLLAQSRLNRNQEIQPPEPRQ